MSEHTNLTKDQLLSINDRLVDQCEALQAQNSDLLAALKDAVDVMERSQPHEGGYTWQRLEQARAAIAGAKETE